MSLLIDAVKLEKVLKFMDENNNNMPTPEACGCDNSEIGEDTLTEYTRTVKAAYLLRGYVANGQG
jgi:hypothetical protein